MLKLFAAGVLLPFSITLGAQTRATLDPKPRAGAAKLARGLARFANQTRFTSVLTRHPESISAVTLPGAGELGPGLAQLGPAGSRAVLIVNPYRGLLVLRDTDGEPRLIGRVPATGFTPTALYVDWAKHRALVIEDRPDRATLNPAARLLLYDLSNLAAPRVANVIELHGSVVTSRVIGDTLYIAGHRCGINGTNPWSGRESFVRSFRLDTFDVRPVADVPLRHPLDQRGQLAIRAESPERAFVIAISADPRRVEVLDISSPDGQITPVLIAATVGHVAAPEWVDVGEGRVRIASTTESSAYVETFALPRDSEHISDEEFQYRRLGSLREGGANARLRNVVVPYATKRGITTFLKPLADAPPVEVAARDPRIFFHDGRAIVSRDDGVEIIAENAAARALAIDGHVARTLAYTLTGRAYLVVLSREATGARARLWRLDTLELLADETFDDLAWSGSVLKEEFDVATGRVRLLVAATRAGGIGGGQRLTIDLAGEAIHADRFADGDASWLARAFHHPDLGAAMTFTDRHFGVFAAGRAHVTTLAPDVVTAVTVGAARARLIQNAHDVTVQVDGRTDQVTAAGLYRAHAVSADRLVLISTTDDHYVVTVVDQKATHQASVAGNVAGASPFVAVPSDVFSTGANGWLFFDDARRPITITLAETLGVARAVTPAFPEPLRAATAEIVALDGAPYVFLRRPVTARRRARVDLDRYSENFVAPVHVAGTALRWPQRFYNVPGRPVGVVGEAPRAILSVDSRETDRAGVVESVLHLTRVRENEARLTGVAAVPENLPLTRVSATQWLFIEPIATSPGVNHFGLKQTYRVGLFEVRGAEPTLHRRLITLDRPLEGAAARIAAVIPGATTRERRVIIAENSALTAWRINLASLEGRALAFDRRSTFALDPDAPAPAWHLPEAPDVRATIAVDGDEARLALGPFGECAARLAR